MAVSSESLQIFSEVLLSSQGFLSLPPANGGDIRVPSPRPLGQALIGREEAALSGHQRTSVSMCVRARARVCMSQCVCSTGGQAIALGPRLFMRQRNLSCSLQFSLPGAGDAPPPSVRLALSFCLSRMEHDGLRRPAATAGGGLCADRRSGRTHRASLARSDSDDWRTGGECGISRALARWGRSVPVERRSSFSTSVESLPRPRCLEDRAGPCPGGRGGASGAQVLFLYFVIRPPRFLRLRAGWVAARKGRAGPGP
jgi:hypothetical protein